MVRRAIQKERRRMYAGGYASYQAYVPPAYAAPPPLPPMQHPMPMMPPPPPPPTPTPHTYGYYYRYQ
ncbi:acrosin-like [Solenopsis invicta]|uniref:acrosin-like n=1 Tax=Solenopsis invicta TaxID=13686 RepID=UPI00193E9354|nr:acrosin-like [Solenopsis invicta]